MPKYMEIHAGIQRCLSRREKSVRGAPSSKTSVPMDKIWHSHLC